ncbi:MAG: PDZ domain-containing protein [Planctomycetes bacterium]|nr:PDZ domain-containing protein [Planctomycetota bacterium]
MPRVRPAFLRFAWLLLFALALAPAVRPVCAEEDALNAEQVRELTQYLLHQHLCQHTLDQTFMKRLIKEFLKRLDPSRTVYLQSEADDKLKQTPEELDKLAKNIEEGDLSYFSNWIKEYKTKYLSRDDEYFAGLKNRKADVGVKIAKDEIEKIKPDSYPTTDDERRKRTLLLARSNYEFYKSYQPEEDAFKLALQTLARLREQKNKIDADKDTPKEFMKAFTSALDPHSEYMDTEEFDDFKTSMQREFSGIGVQIRACLLGAQVVDVIKDKPAFQSGKFTVDDQIIAVDGFSLAGLPLDQVVRRIKGDQGTKVKISLKKAAKDGEEPKMIDVELVRAKIELADIKVPGKLFPTPSGNVGYIAMENFYDGVSGDVTDRIKELSKAEPLAGLILDLRNNGGGYLEEAIKLAGLFITKGPIVAERGRNKKVVWRSDPDPKVVFAGPLVVLVNQFSASASEIVSGSLKDYGRAVLVGPTQTHGKGTVQTIVDLGIIHLPGAMRLTVQQYFIAGGDSTQNQGVQPDIKIPGRKLVEDFLEKAQDGALPSSKVEPLLDENQPDFKRYFAWKEQNLEALRTKSAKRVETNKDFDLYKDQDPDKVADGPDAEPPPKGVDNPENGGKNVTDNPAKPKDKKDLKDPQRDEAGWTTASVERRA